MTDLNAILTIESDGDVSEDEFIDAVQSLIDSGTIWLLQGWYGQLATDLINQGLCHVPFQREEEE
jgi:hypothetical protein